MDPPCLPDPEAVGEGTIIFSDFDGTITRADVAEAILQRFTGDAWWAVEEEYRRGDIGSREALVRQFALVKAGKLEVLSFAETIPLDPGFMRFQEYCKAECIPLVVLSEGLRPYIERILAVNGVGGQCVVANGARFSGDGMEIIFGHPNEDCPDCGTCKAAVIDLYPSARKVYVGDGYSDMCAAGHADVLFVKSHLLEHCRKESIACIPYAGFGDVLDWLKREA